MNPLTLNEEEHGLLESVESRINACLDYIALFLESDSPHTRSDERGSLAMVQSHLSGAIGELETVMSNIEERRPHGGSEGAA